MVKIVPPTVKDIYMIAEYDQMMQSREIIPSIPYIKFPSDWEVKVIPPFSGAVARFMVRKGDVEVSVYLDYYGLLGAEYTPYWEVYPHNHDTFRCEMNDTEALINAINEALLPVILQDAKDNKALN